MASGHNIHQGKRGGTTVSGDDCPIVSGDDCPIVSGDDCPIVSGDDCPIVIRK